MAEALKNDRARIQIGHISHFGLLELSRQRLRPSLAETSLTICAHCGGAGHVRSTESAALHVLREIEEEGGRRRAAEILVHVASATALYILNHKRQRLTEIEQRCGMTVCFAPDESLLPAQTRIDRIRASLPGELPPPVPQAQPMPDDDAAEADIGDDEDDVVMQEAGTAACTEQPAGDFTTDADHVPGETAEEGERRRKRRRRRRRGGRREEAMSSEAAPVIPDGAEQPDLPDLESYAPYIGSVTVQGHDEAGEAAEPARQAADDSSPDLPALETPLAESDATRAKRGRRGGRRRRKPGDEAEAAFEPPPPQAYLGPTPADPFALVRWTSSTRWSRPNSGRQRPPTPRTKLPPPILIRTTRRRSPIPNPPVPQRSSRC